MHVQAFTYVHVFTHPLPHTHTHIQQFLQKARTGRLLGHQHELLLHVQRANIPHSVSFKKDHSRVVRGLQVELVLAPPDAEWVRRQEECKMPAHGEMAIISQLSIRPLALCPQNLRCVHRALHCMENVSTSLKDGAEA